MNATRKVKLPGYFHIFSFPLNRSVENSAFLDHVSKGAGLLRAVPPESAAQYQCFQSTGKERASEKQFIGFTEM